MKRRSLILAALVPMLAGAAPEKAAVADFIRVDEDQEAARLQTALTRYQKDGVTVDLIGAVHIADKAYYQKLNERFDDYDALLFEMIGGRDQDRAAQKKKAKGKPNAAKSEAKQDKDKNNGKGKGKGAAKDDPEDSAQKEDPPNLDVLHQVYGLVSGFLQLTDQMSHIDYSKKHFVHADLSLEEFQRLQEERGESVIGFALEAGRKAEEEGGAAKQPDVQALMTALLAGNANRVKLEIVHTLGEGDNQIAAFAGESVIIGDRNAKCVEVLREQVKAGKRKLGIFYGAAHFPDMAKRLEELGYKRVKQEWLTAWNIPKPKPAAEKPEPDSEELKDAA